MHTANENGVDSSLPIIDLSSFQKASTLDEKRVRAQELVAACRDIGFVYITGHGVPREEIKRAFEVSEMFYKLPQEDKMKAPHPPGWAVHRGYSWPGLEKVSNALSENDDQEAAENLREVQDFKVQFCSLVLQKNLTWTFF